MESETIAERLAAAGLRVKPLVLDADGYSEDGRWYARKTLTGEFLCVTPEWRTYWSTQKQAIADCHGQWIDRALAMLEAIPSEEPPR
jgi:hypothetical protein